MIDKERTIDKAIARYHTVFPVRGKHSLSECFFRLKGEYFFVFMTKDKKVRSIKACLRRTVSAPPPQGESTSSRKENTILKILNKPIIIRSMIIKKPVGTWLINLFPTPGISWCTSSRKIPDTTSAPQSRDRRSAPLQRDTCGDCLTMGNDWTSEYGSNNRCRSSDLIAQAEGNYPYQRNCFPKRLETIASGHMPLNYPSDLSPMPAVETVHPFSSIDYAPDNSPSQPDFSWSSYQYGSPHTPYRYEIIAHGYLPVHTPEWLSAG